MTNPQLRSTDHVLTTHVGSLVRPDDLVTALRDRVRAKEAIAESYYLRGGIHEAAMQLQELTRDDDLDYYERARITSRINDLRLELAKMGAEKG